MIFIVKLMLGMLLFVEFIGIMILFFVSAVIAIFPMSWIEVPLQNMHKFFLIATPDFARSLVIVTLIIIGTAFGAIGSFLSIKKHLQV